MLGNGQRAHPVILKYPVTQLTLQLNEHNPNRQHALDIVPFGNSVVLIMYIMFHSLCPRLKTYTERTFAVSNFDGVLSPIRFFWLKKIHQQISNHVKRAFEISASKMKPIKIVPYSKNWKLEFLTLERSIRNLVGPTATRIDHTA